MEKKISDAVKPDHSDVASTHLRHPPTACSTGQLVCWTSVDWLEISISLRWSSQKLDSCKHIFPRYLALCLLEAARVI